MGGGEQAKYLKRVEVYNLIAEGRAAEIPPMGEEAVPALVKVVEESPYWQKEIAVRALGQIGGQKAMRALKAMLEHGEMGVRIEAIKALGGKKGGWINSALERIADEDPVWNVRKTAEKALMGGSIVPRPPVENGNLRLNMKRGGRGKAKMPEKMAGKEAY